MKVREGITVTSVSLEGYELPIPEGFSEFLLRAGYWVYGEEVEVSNNAEILSNYDKKVVMKDGQLRTILTYKGNKKKRGKSA
ncbi:hypothetical protein P4U07_13395 [Bacillus mycoides]|uniref:hypothetical protein n=1 Tax=Bacillus cereus group TaxID=86661 RepID=UPI0021113A2D|nr:hypothetical protein [Bacillus mycoides]MCQ6356433.1 hypothetical protein [Bacillus cereus]MED1403807.1 hypothetical protein [Bacillus mycoides]